MLNRLWLKETSLLEKSSVVWLRAIPKNIECWQLSCCPCLDKWTFTAAPAKSPLKQSKYTILPRYTFNLCFENSMFPGYYTEKVLHAWAAGCVPLYFADRFYSEDFNPAAIINRADFTTASDFVENVGRIYNSRNAVQEITRQPLILRRPSLERVVRFLQEAVTKIRRERRFQFPINLP
jgi:hypothetical protein